MMFAGSFVYQKNSRMIPEALKYWFSSYYAHNRMTTQLGDQLLPKSQLSRAEIRFLASEQRQVLLSKQEDVPSALEKAACLTD